MFEDNYKKAFKYKEPSKELINKTKEKLIYQENKSKKFIFRPRYAIGVLLVITLFISFSGSFENINIFNLGRKLTQNSIEEDVININPMGENNSFSDMKLAYDPEQTYEEFLNLEGIFNYLGKDVRPKYYPEDLQEYQDTAEEYRNNQEYMIIKNNDGTVAHDAIQFSYCDDFTYTKLPVRYFYMEVSKIGYQADCVIYMEQEKMKPSVINGVEMDIGFRELSYGPYDNPEGYYNLYYAEFYNDEIYYKVNAENLEEEEFINILRSLVS
ncbi:hypothetical protein [Clostridium sp.]|uniref:hypothetical protein n=1 Tax=Clostridium sp. TaxID=1506 RepID=UPI00260DDD52|nr:hypothetical protein [Clostridium sp.]